jgi:hypothetical protein
MKNFILITAITFLSFGAMAQGTVITSYFTKYADNESFTKVSVSQKMFSLFTELEAGSDSEKEFLQAVSKLQGLKIIVADSIPNAMTVYNQAVADVKKAGYEELMTVTGSDENMLFSIKETNGIISELIMVVGGKEDFVMLSLYGEIDLKNISKIAQEMRVEGLEKLSEIDENDDKK